jgi:GT2 family glycosyltransferase
MTDDRDPDALAADASEAASANPPDLTVVIPSYHRAKRLVELIGVLLTDADALAATGERIEIVPVIDGPDVEADRALATVTDPRVRPLFLPENVGIAGARRAGTRIAAGDVVVQLDDDVQPLPGTLAVHLAAHRADSMLVLLGHMPIFPDDLPASQRVASTLYSRAYDASWESYLADSDRVLAWLWGGYVSARREHLLAAEDMAELWPRLYHEDADQGLRLRALGLHGRAEPAAAAIHLHRRNLAAVLREANGMGLGLAELQRRWGKDVVPSPDYLAGGGLINGVLGAVDRLHLSTIVIVVASKMARAAEVLRLEVIERRSIQLARRLVMKRSYARASATT